MNICMITHLPVWNKSQGAETYIYNIMNNFKNDKIIFVYLGSLDEKEKKEILSKHNIISNIYCINSFRVNFRRALKRGLAILKMNRFYHLKKPFTFGLLSQNKLKRICKQESIDTILLNYIWYHNILDKIDNNTRKVIITHDVQNQFCKTFKKNNKEIFLDINEKDEISILNKYDLAACISTFDYNYFKKRINNAIYLPPIVKFNNLPMNEQRNRCFGFIGGAAQFNVDGLQWFLDECLPLIETDYTFNVYGNVTKYVNNKNPNVKLYGFVENLDDVYLNNCFMVNPNFIGGGLKIKNIESLCNNRPLITTSLGAQGFETGIDRCIKVANTKEEFANCINELLLSFNNVVELQKNCRDYINEWFGIELFNEFYSKLA